MTRSGRTLVTSENTRKDDWSIATSAILETISVEPRVEPAQRRSILNVEGTLRVPVRSRLREELTARLCVGERRILLDLADLSEIDAAGIGELVRAFNTTRAAGGVLQVANANRRVGRLLDVAGLLELLTAGAPGGSRSVPRH